MEDILDLFHCNFCQSNHNNIIRRTWLSKLPPVRFFLIIFLEISIIFIRNILLLKFEILFL